jgi:hypothetical protein
MSKRKFFSFLVITILIMTPLTACGASDTPEDEMPADEPAAVEQDLNEEESPAEQPSEETAADAEAEAEVRFNNLRNIDNLDSLTNLFSSLQYEWRYNETDFSQVTYSATADETINGIDTTKIVITIENNETTEEMNFWVDEDGTTVKALMNGQEIPGEMFQNMADAIINSIFWPFTLAQNYTEGPAFNEAAESVPGYEVNIDNMGQSSLNGKDYTHYVTNINIGPPYSEDPIEYVWQIGDFGDFQLLLNWETKEAPMDAKMQFEVIDFELK